MSIGKSLSQLIFNCLIGLFNRCEIYILLSLYSKACVRRRKSVAGKFLFQFVICNESLFICKFLTSLPELDSLQLIVVLLSLQLSHILIGLIFTWLLGRSMTTIGSLLYVSKTQSIRKYRLCLCNRSMLTYLIVARPIREKTHQINSFFADVLFSFDGPDHPDNPSVAFLSSLKSP